jgi:uncharacterized protein YndB with AHSA1/START domain
MSEIRIVEDYPYSIDKVWRALTDPGLIPLWTVTGQGARTVGFSTEVGTKFQYVAKPMRGWNGIVDSEVLECEEPALLRYTWTGGGEEDTSYVTYRLAATAEGTRFTYEHVGFKGVGGLLMSKILGRVRGKMLRTGLPAVLADLDENGALLPSSQLRARSFG